MQDAPVRTPVDISQKLTKAVDGEALLDQSEYQSAVGCLLYLYTSTQPDISFAVSNVAKYSSEPTQRHWNAVKRMLRYLNDTTTTHGLMYTARTTEDLHGLFDSDWAGDLDNRKSTSGYLFLLRGAPISWRSKKQSTVALSTAEAEFIALSYASQEAMGLWHLISELKLKPSTATILSKDNQAAITMAHNSQHHRGSKHINIRCHFI